MLVKILSTSGVGAAALLASNAASQPVANSLLLSVVGGGITLLTQFLMEFEKRLDSLEASQKERLAALASSQEEALQAIQDNQAKNLKEARGVIERGFTRVGDATSLLRQIERSMFGVNEITELAQRSSKIKSDALPLARDLAQHEIKRLAKLFQELSTGNEIVYDGEDREWLLGLTASVRQSIDAISLSFADAGNRGFDNGLWTSDLGSRYLNLQREAISKRGVVVRRIFVFDKPGFTHEPDHVRILRAQRDAGVQVRALNECDIPDHLKNTIFDFILFDQAITYEMTTALLHSNDAPALFRTHLIPTPTLAQDRAKRFERLWELAVELPEAGPQSAQAGSAPPGPTKT